jgi:multiple sugar transport system substrate-binding protein
MRKRVLVGIGLTTAAAFLFSLSRAQSPTEVTLLFWPGPESEAMQKVLDAYNGGAGAKDGVSVKQILFSRQGYFEKEETDLAAGSKEFDLGLITTYTLGRYAPYLEPIDASLNKTSIAGFLPSAVSSLNFGGKQYGVPTDVSNHFTYYRKDLVQKLLTDAKWKAAYTSIAQKALGKALVPKKAEDWTWDDFIATSLFFTKSLNPDSPTTYGAALQLKNILFNIMIWQSTLVSYGGDLFDKSGKPTIDSQAARQGLNVYNTIIKNKAVPPGATTYEYGEANEAFRTGNVALTLQWSAAFNELSDKEKSPLVFDKVAIAPMPAGPQGHKTHVHSLGIGLNKASAKKDAAGKFLAYLGSEAAMKVYADAGGLPPVANVLKGMAAQRPEFPIVADHLGKYGFVVTGGTAAYAVPVYTALAEEFSAVWAGQKSVDDALKAATEKMTKLAAGK